MATGVANEERRTQTEAKNERADEERDRGVEPLKQAAIPSEDNTSAALEAVRLPSPRPKKLRVTVTNQKTEKSS